MNFPVFFTLNISMLLSIFWYNYYILSLFMTVKMHFYYHPQFVVLTMQPVKDTLRVTLEKLEWLLGYNIIAFLFCQVNSGIFESSWGICWNRTRKPRDVLKVGKFYYKQRYTKMQTLEWNNLSWFIQTSHQDIFDDPIFHPSCLNRQLRLLFTYCTI